MRIFQLLACPYCDSEIGQQVSAGIFNAEFGLNALLTLLPMFVLAAIVYFIHFGEVWPTRPGGRDSERQPR